MASLKIFINHTEIAFTLETEKNAFEVVTGILTWIKERNLMLSSLKIDNKTVLYPPLAEELKRLELEKIATIDCEAVNVSTYSASLCLTAGEELAILAQALSESHLKTYMEQISKKLTWIRHALLQSSTMLALTQLFMPIIQLLKELESHLYKISRGETPFNKAAIDTLISQALTLLNDHFLLLQTRALTHDLKLLEKIKSDPTYTKEDILTFTTHLKYETYPLLETMGKWTSKIATYFQQDKTPLALALLTDLTGAISLFLTIYNLDTDNKAKKADIVEATKPLEAILKQIVTAFEAEDYVEVSDLLEYELTPILSQFTEKLPKPPNKVQAITEKARSSQAPTAL
ncbi:hypothetical protein COTS27_01425 [Spirochaetota bacterium]|nr:hypothetical protein COTS27_01425 [Spirochaetota bacterium]